MIDAGTDVIATFEDGGGAGNTNTLFLHSPFASGIIFQNHISPVDVTFNLGPFASGIELLFKIESDDDITSIETFETWFTGPASRNDDNFAHAVVTDLGSNTVRVAFEDLRDGGDTNFGDMVFTLSNAAIAPVPEPETYALMLAGLGLIGGAAPLTQRPGAPPR